jgi:hypothetical protein
MEPWRGPVARGVPVTLLIRSDVWAHYFYFAELALNSILYLCLMSYVELGRGSSLLKLMYCIYSCVHVHLLLSHVITACGVLRWSSTSLIGRQRHSWLACKDKTTHAIVTNRIFLCGEVVHDGGEPHLSARRITPLGLLGLGVRHAASLLLLLTGGSERIGGLVGHHLLRRSLLER